ncbi:MAG: hypothetical protein KJ906_04195 [Nanoarchaeota archaeon]|nr:hypothetical protein [Nanoarchaeota archaeon]
MVKNSRAYEAGKKRGEAIGTLLNRVKNEEDQETIKEYDYNTGTLFAESIAEDAHLMYNNSTAKNYLIGLQKTLMSKQGGKDTNKEFYSGLFGKLCEENEVRGITIGDIHG